MSDDLVERLQAGSIWGRSVHDTLIEWMKERKRAADRIEELEAALLELIDHTHNCEKELTEELHHQDFCGESLPLTKARTTLATLKGQNGER